MAAVLKPPNVTRRRRGSNENGKHKYVQKIAHDRIRDRRIKMKKYPYLPSMVQAITVLTVLKMMTKDSALAQTSCGSGSMNGKVLYERLPNIQLQGFDDDVVRDTGPPFAVLEKCRKLCSDDRSSNNIVRACASFDFQPGSRIASYNGGADYEESLCYLTNEAARPDGMAPLMISPNSIHFTEVCLTSTRPGRECPNRLYVFERHPRKKLKLPQQDLKEMQAENRTQCEDICLNEFSFVCRSATFDFRMKTCTLSRFTRRTHPELLQDDPDSDYLENTCLDPERRCDGLAVFIKEENKRLGGPFEVAMFSNLTLDECQAMCVNADKYLCRSLEYDEMTKQCTLSEEDSVSQKDDIGVASSPTHHFYDFVCLDSPRGSEYPDNSVTSHLFSDKNKKPDTAFQRYRNSRLSGDHHSEISGRSLSECLDECLRQPSFQCKSAEYSERFRSCKLIRFNQRDGMRIIYDADYDYYENLMLGGDDSTSGGSHRPGEGSYRPGDVIGGDRHRPSSSGGRFPPIGGRYPTTTGSRYPPSSGGYDDYDRPGYDRYPDDRYPNDIIYPGGDRDRPSMGGGRYPLGPDRYPSNRYPTDRYPPDRYPPRYPPSSGGGGRNPYDRYPPSYSGGRFPPSSSGGKYPLFDRYPPSASGGGRYPSGGGRYPYEDRYPFKPERPMYSGGSAYDSRYGNRYGDRYDYRHDPYMGDRIGSRYGGLDDRLGSSGGRYDGAGSRIFSTGGRFGSPSGSHYDSNRYDYYGDERDGGSRWFFRPDRRPLGRPIDLDHGYRRPNDAIGYNRPIDIGTRPIEIRPGFGRPPAGGYDRPVGGYDRPVGGYDRPVGNRRPISPGPDGPIYDRPPLDDFGGNGIGIGGSIGGSRPYHTRCDEGDNFKQMGTRQRARKEYVRKALFAPTLLRCQQECISSEDFICRSFNFRDLPSASNYDTDRDNCELSDRDSRDMEMGNPVYFDSTGGYDFYERSMARSGLDGECLDVSQVCNEDGMEFTLRTPEPFYGRIYTHGFYERCFFRGNGGTVNVLRISGAQGYPECGTQRYGDTMTNIVVVQFTENVQTGRDKRFNLTCLFRGPGEAVVSSGFIGAGSGSPIPIEYLPAENTLSSKVRLMILYQGRPTTTIAVGDPLTFRIEAQDGYNYLTDIFATNVVARDPYSGRSVQLIDRVGCPVDPFVFPELDKGRSGDTLEARFNAFKIPESNFLVFEATVRTCRDGCQPAYCQTGSGRSEPSFGRRRRSINETALLEGSNSTTTDLGSENSIETNSLSSTVKFYKVSTETPMTKIEDNEIKVVSEGGVSKKKKENDETEYVREMIEVFDTREEIAEAQRAEPAPNTICLSKGEYHGLISAVFCLVAILLTASLLAGLAYRKYWLVMRKNMLLDRVSSSNFSTAPSYPTSSTKSTSGLSIFGTMSQKPFGVGILNPSFPISPKNSRDFDCPGGALSGLFEDPSEPIYTDPSLFERSRSLRSIAVSSKRRKSPPTENKI